MFTGHNSPSDTPHFTTCLKGRQILQEPTYRQTWKAFREQIPLSDFDFDQYYTATLAKFAEYVQFLPATRHVYYAQPGGLFQLSLDRAMLSTKLALKSFHDLENKTPEQLNAHELAEVFAVFAAALLSDLGLLSLRFKIKICDEENLAAAYDPYAGGMNQQGKMYYYEFTNPELLDWSAPGSLVLASHLLCDTQKDYRDSGFAWISRYHDILQMWYAMMLDLTPVVETTTRKRYLISLIPLTDNDLLQNFLLNIHHAGLLLPNKQSHTLFTPQEVDQEFLNDHGFELDHTTEATQRARGEFEKVFGGGGGAADASNTQMLGSLGAALAPQLRYGLAFLGWLIALARAGKLWAADGQTGLAFGYGGGKIVLHLQGLLDKFVSEKNVPKISVQELINSLKETQLLKSQNLHPQTFELKNPNANIAAMRFEGLMLPASFLLGNNQEPPKITLALQALGREIAAHAHKERIQAHFQSMFHIKPPTL